MPTRRHFIRSILSEGTWNRGGYRVEGALAVAARKHPSPLAIPAFGWKPDDAEMVALSTFVRSSWRSADEVRTLRQPLAEGPP